MILTIPVPPDEVGDGAVAAQVGVSNSQLPTEQRIHNSHIFRKESMTMMAAFLLVLFLCAMSALALDDGTNMVIRVWIDRYGKHLRYGQCSLREQQVVISALHSSVQVTNGQELQANQPWWCHGLCQAYLTEPCWVFHPSCPVYPVRNDRLRSVGDNRMAEIFDSDANLHPNQKERRTQTTAFRTHCFDQKVHVLKQLKSEMGETSVSDPCLNYLKTRMKVSCFLVEEMLEETPVVAEEDTMTQPPFETDDRETN